MIKDRRFNVHPEVLSCFLHLRLRGELAVRASDSKADESGGKASGRRGKGKRSDTPHLNKKARKALKEKRAIEREFRDAEAEVDKEERTITVRIVFFFLRVIL